MFEALERVVGRGDLTDADGAPVRFEARPPATADEIMACERLLRRGLPDEYAAFLRRWNGVRLYRRHTPADRPEGAFDGLTLSLMGTEELAAYAWHPRVALLPPHERWHRDDGEVFACVQVHATDGADFLGYDLAAGSFLDMQGYVGLEEVRRRVLAPDLDGFLERFVAERFALFWVGLFG